MNTALLWSHHIPYRKESIAQFLPELAIDSLMTNSGQVNAREKQLGLTLNKQV